MYYAFTIVLSIFLFFFGAAVYSFLNVVIFRVPRGEEFVKTRSHCPGCGRILTPLELIPVVSYVCLGGKCKNCGSKIGLRDVSIEVFGGLSAIASVAYAYYSMLSEKGGNPLFIVWTSTETSNILYNLILMALFVFSFIGAMTVITFIDIDTGKVHGGTMIALAATGIPSCPFLIDEGMSERLIGAVCGAVIFYILGLVAKNREFYAGAVLFGVAGLMYGWRVMLAMAGLAVLLGALEAILLLMTGNKKLEHRFKFLPVLCMAVLVGIFFGMRLSELFFI